MEAREEATVFLNTKVVAVVVLLSVRARLSREAGALIGWSWKGYCGLLTYGSRPGVPYSC